MGERSKPSSPAGATWRRSGRRCAHFPRALILGLFCVGQQAVRSIAALGGSCTDTCCPAVPQASRASLATDDVPTCGVAAFSPLPSTSRVLRSSAKAVGGGVECIECADGPCATEGDRKVNPANGDGCKTQHDTFRELVPTGERNRTSPWTLRSYAARVASPYLPSISPHSLVAASDPARRTPHSAGLDLHGSMDVVNGALSQISSIEPAITFDTAGPPRLGCAMRSTRPRRPAEGATLGASTPAPVCKAAVPAREALRSRDLKSNVPRVRSASQGAGPARAHSTRSSTAAAPPRRTNSNSNSTLTVRRRPARAPASRAADAGLDLPPRASAQDSSKRCQQEAAGERDLALALAHKRARHLKASSSSLGRKRARHLKAPVGSRQAADCNGGGDARGDALHSSGDARLPRGGSSQNTSESAGRREKASSRSSAGRRRDGKAALPRSTLPRRAPVCSPSPAYTTQEP